MKRLASLLLALCLAACLLVPSALAVEFSDMPLTYDLSVEGQNSVTVPADSVITVTFAIRRTDSQEAYQISVLQNEIIYDQDFFEFVEDSMAVAKPGFAGVYFQTRTTGVHIVKCSDMNGSYDADTAFCTFQLRVKATSGSGWVSCDEAIAYDVHNQKIVLTEQNLTVTVASDSTDNGDNGGSGDNAGGGGSDSGGGSGSGPVQYAVTLPEVENGTVRADRTSAASGTTVVLTLTPDSGYQVESLAVTDGSGNAVPVTDRGDGTYTFQMPASPVSVSAAFQVEYAGLGSEEEPAPSARFEDIPADAWYADAVDYVVGKGYLLGISDTQFAPTLPLTRGMLATVIARMEGADLSGYTTSDFTDVADGQWYTASVAWAAQYGIVKGYGDGRFGPEDPLTREQMMVVLCRYADYCQAEISGLGTSLESFADYRQVSDWAVDSVRWAVENGLVHGTGSAIEPLRAIARDEFVQLIVNYDQALS
jgi:uncharacterized membrane protein YgcG